MRIGEIATQADVNMQTIRFYEREGLLRKPGRTQGGYRSYDRQDLDRIRFIRACQGLGFTLREIRQLIRLHRVTVSSHQGASMQPATVKEILAIAEERSDLRFNGSCWFSLSLPPPVSAGHSRSYCWNRRDRCLN